MGEQIRKSAFTREDARRFHRRLARETRHLREWLAEHPNEPCRDVVGLELEAWLVDGAGQPVPANGPFLEAMHDPGVVAEIGAFNVEFNQPPAELCGTALSQVYGALRSTWERASDEAGREDLELAMIGMLPSLTPDHLHLDQMTDQPRYRALNNGILRLRDREPLRIRVDGDRPLDFESDNVMMEAALTSFQVHLQTTQAELHRVYNAGVIAAAPLVAATCNSAYVFGEPLWQESRIPVFEQVFSLKYGPPRVSLGRAYLSGSLQELFDRNLTDHPVLLPQVIDAPADELRHLRLHNGSIWRWVRPVVDSIGGRPLLRVEHRVMPAGPTVDDCMANAVLAWGLMLKLAQRDPPPECELPFATAAANLEAAARDGLRAELRWLDGNRHPARDILLQLLPEVREALLAKDLDAREVDYWLRLLEDRFRAGRTGADWQRSWSEAHGGDGAALTRAYLERQQAARPAHRWSI